VLLNRILNRGTLYAASSGPKLKLGVNENGTRPWPLRNVTQAPRTMDFTLRKATLNDRSAIQQLIADSARGLSTEDYTSTQIEAALLTVFGFDTDLVLDRTYMVAESDGKVVGCGGWSKRKTLFGGDQYPTRDSAKLDPAVDPAKIRAFFVHPRFARKGIGRAILAACENEAKAAGFSSIELMATLPGVKLYKACGYDGESVIEHELKSGVTLPLVPMKKSLL